MLDRIQGGGLSQGSDGHLVLLGHREVGGVDESCRQQEKECRRNAVEKEPEGAHRRERMKVEL